MQAGRPLLVVPDSVDWLDLRSVLVAWKDTPEARRAIADSLPMLRKAKDVTVAEIVEDGDGRPAAASRVRDVVAWLSRHGVSASERVRGEGWGPGRDRAARWNCRRRRRRSRCRGRLWSFAIPRIDPRRHDPASHHPIRPLRAAVALEATSTTEEIGSRLVQISRANRRRLHDARSQDGDARSNGARSQRNVRARRFQLLSGRRGRTGGRHRHQVRPAEMFCLYAESDDSALRAN